MSATARAAASDGAAASEASLGAVRQWLREHGFADALSALDAQAFPALPGTSNANSSIAASVAASTRAAAALLGSGADDRESDLLAAHEENFAECVSGGIVDELVRKHCVILPRGGRHVRVRVGLDLADVEEEEGTAGRESQDGQGHESLTRRAALEWLLEIYQGETPANADLGAVDSAHRANVLSVAFGNRLGLGEQQDTVVSGEVVGEAASARAAAFGDHDVRLLATGSTDRTVKVSDAITGHQFCDFVGVHGGAVLSVDFNPRFDHLLLSGAMDGHHAVLDIRNNGSVVQQFADHQKYVVAARWHPDGHMFATASHDHTVCLYKCSEETLAQGDTPVFKKVQTFMFRTNAEDLTFSRDGKLIVAVREDNNLQIVDLESESTEKFNMNEKGDDHVSFSALNISLSPASTTSEEYLLVSTDANKLLMFHRGDSKPVRTFYGAANDAFCQPRNAWHSSGRFVYSTSQDNLIYSWDVRTQLQLAQMQGHTSTIRDMRTHPVLPLLATGSFDKTVRLWSI